MAKVNFNMVEINGEVVDVYDMKEDNFDNFEFKMKVRIQKEDKSYDDREVLFKSKKTTNSGEANKRYLGFLTVYDEIKTITENEIGDRVSLRCKLAKNSYYFKGNLYEKPELIVEYCNREKDGKTYDDNQAFSVYTYIEDIVENEESIDYKVLINEYKTDRSIKGHELTMKVLDKELFDDFRSTYKKGDVAQLDGEFMDLKVKIEVPEEDLVELVFEPVEVKGIGSKIKKLEEENKRNKEKIDKENERRRRIREEGLFRNVVELVVTGGDLPISCEDAEELEYPFDEDSIDMMVEGIDERLDKSKERDMKRNPSDWMNQEVDTMDTPF